MTEEIDADPIMNEKFFDDVERLRLLSRLLRGSNDPCNAVGACGLVWREARKRNFPSFTAEDVRLWTFEPHDSKVADHMVTTGYLELDSDTQKYRCVEGWCDGQRHYS